MIIENLSILLGVLGVALGVILAFSSKIFAVQEDPRLKEIERCLPGLNCGACGFAGCHGYAIQIMSGKAELNLCKIGGAKATAELAKIMKKPLELKEPMVVHRYCSGGLAQAKQKFTYTGIKSCRAAILLNYGFKECPYSCLGYGDCVDVCPVAAIVITKNGLAKINRNLCVGCEKCVKECPRAVLRLSPKKMPIHVKCSNQGPAKLVAKFCQTGCISCRICEKKCLFDAIHVLDRCAVIDYAKCKQCGVCADVCPRKLIINEREKQTLIE